MNAGMLVPGNTLTDVFPASTLAGMVLGFLAGAAMAVMLGWGIALLLGRPFVIRTALVAVAFLFGLSGAVIGDAAWATKRPLNAEEREIAQQVFGASLHVDKVKLAFGARLMTFPKRRYSRTPGNTVFFSEKYSGAAETSYLLRRQYLKTLVHELTHAWQRQHGISVWKKLGPSFGKAAAYDYGDLASRRLEQQHFRDLNTEQQASLMADYFYCIHYSCPLPGAGCNCEDLEYFAMQVQEKVE